MNNENQRYLFFSGYHMTEHASEVLKDRDIYGRIVKAPVHLKNSCNFALAVDYEDLDRSMAILAEKGIKIYGIK